MPMSQQERAAADARVRSALGVLRKGTQPDAPAMPPRPGSAAAVTASTKLAIDDEVYAIQQYGYGEIWGRPALKLTERSFLTLGVLAATAQSDQLAIHVNNALNLGITPDEICETLLHVGVYAGGSIWHNASNVVRYVFVERGVLAPGSGARPAANPPTTREQRQTLAEQVRRALGPGRIGLDDDAPSLRPLPGAEALTSIDTLPVEDEHRPDTARIRVRRGAEPLSSGLADPGRHHGGREASPAVERRAARARQHRPEPGRHPGRVARGLRPCGCVFGPCGLAQCHQRRR